MDLEIALRWLHVLGACVLIGTGIGIAFFMLMAHRTRDPHLIAGTARIVVIADTLFTATAALAQPITGVLLAREVGWPLDTPWIIASIMLYLLIGACWIPVVGIQIRLRDLASTAARDGGALPERYDRLFRVWFILGIPAFSMIVILLWLMLARPDF
ncbi:MAG: DUF2269 domain-containing protein [Neomegalonema sp.]|nr:DUF2269 domain-containing protein [Neomegalonema sp.]